MFFIDPSSHDIGRSASSAPAAFTPSVRRGWRSRPRTSASRPRPAPSASPSTCCGAARRWRSGYWQLRSAIFCQEQHLFEATDRDEKDGHAYPIAALDHSAGSGSGVVGVVRILEERPRLWYGGRLGVHGDHRRHNQIGKGLIWKAVTTANGWGCDRFLATVQLQNVRFFQRLHWTSIEVLEIRGLPHHLMEADLAYYQPGLERRPLAAVA